MIDAAALDAMLAAGCSAEQIVATVKASLLADHDAAAGRREADRLRKRRQRERETSIKTMVASEVSRVTSVTSRDIPSPPPAPSPDKETPPLHPPKENNLFPEPPPQPRVSGARPFDAFWAKYPNKVGKADAIRAFDRAIKRTDINTMMQGLERYVCKTDDRPWCNPATWLNQDRWADQPAEQPGRRPPERRKTAAEITGENLRREIAELQGQGSEESSDLLGPGRVLAISRQAH